MTDLFDASQGATPLEPDERRGLRPSWVATRAELNEVEQVNIAAGAAWAFRSRKSLLSASFVRELHRRMFADVWQWAGQFRATPRNIGVEVYQIAPELKLLLDDAAYWIREAVYPEDEIAVRLHHRLVYIHPFANGNGRHARLMADLQVTRLKRPRFTWGGTTFAEAGEARRRYIEALKLADRHDTSELLEFARS